MTSKRKIIASKHIIFIINEMHATYTTEDTEKKIFQ
ncbi:uncharacterized protein Dana_GF27044 [Drosophila ananassae]|uniref:Uncharacterized protein n=1 Tax=Drosophila ananassae TaxID=7217 RepID=A0A0P9BQ85_DROAN|nr:uncharacterized protein Dana_GF27044 [Drosophila ananassae]